MKNNDEYSQGGSKIYRYENTEAGFTAPDTEDSSLEEIERHIEKYVGASTIVFHEIISDNVHIDIHIINPTIERNYFTLITSGMSDKPMNSPFEEFRYAELITCLPPDWKLSEQHFQNENNYWIVRWLKILARFVHQQNTWLWETHTVPNGDPPQPFADNTKLCCALISQPILFDAEFKTLEVRDDKIIHFLSLIPIYKEEMKYKLDYGVEKLYEKFDQSGVNELLDISRKNTCKKLFGIF
jgi:hypothetical protein